VTSPFAYADGPLPVREDLRRAHARAWQALARPGTWWTGEQRVAIAAATRAARACELCARRRDALSPAAVVGAHERADPQLAEAAVDAVHRIVTDAPRLSRSDLEKLASEGVSDAHYAELLGVVVAVVSIDAFHRALGLEPEPLPVPEPGEPTRARPASAVPDVGWLPMIPEGRASGSESDLYPAKAPHVMRALSLVPDAVRCVRELSAAQYVPMEQVSDPGADSPRALTRPQIELLAGRVSALNECFY
jgi:hypothetical protein